MDTHADVGERDVGATDGNGRDLLRSAVFPLLLTVRDAAEVLAVGRTTMYELITAGEIEVVHIGRSSRVPVAALEAFVEQKRRGTVTVSSSTSSPAAGPRRSAPGRRGLQRSDQGRLFGGPRQQT